MTEFLKDIRIDEIEKRIGEALSQLKKDVTCDCKVNFMDFSEGPTKIEIEVTANIKVG